MPNRIDVLVAVDAEHALSGGSLAGCLYIVDTNGYLGSWRDGRNEVHTVCEDGQVVAWSVTPIDPGNDVVIQGFSGSMVDEGLCVPRSVVIAGSTRWSGQVASRGHFTECSYTVMLGFGSKQLSFEATLKVV